MVQLLFKTIVQRDVEKCRQPGAVTRYAFYRRDIQPSKLEDRFTR